MRRGGRANEELRAIGVWPRIRHAQYTGSRVFQLKILVGKSTTVNATTSRSIIEYEIARLQHETGNDAMKERVFVGHFQALFVDRVTAAERFKVGYSFRDNVTVQPQDNTADGFLVNGDIEVGAVSDFGLRWYRAAILDAAAGSCSTRRKIIGSCQTGGPNGGKGGQFPNII